MSFPFRPKIIYGYDLESDLTLELPMLPWSRGRGGVGGSDTAASGIPEAFMIRRDRIRWFKLRVLESEMDAFDAFLDWAQDSGEPFDFWLDQDVFETSHSVYLQSLRWEDEQEIQHDRDEYLPMFVISMALRTEDGSQWNTTWEDLAVSVDSEES